MKYLSWRDIPLISEEWFWHCSQPENQSTYRHIPAMTGFINYEKNPNIWEWERDWNFMFWCTLESLFLGNWRSEKVHFNGHISVVGINIKCSNCSSKQIQRWSEKQFYGKVFFWYLCVYGTNRTMEKHHDDFFSASTPETGEPEIQSMIL